MQNGLAKILSTENVKGGKIAGLCKTIGVLRDKARVGQAIPGLVARDMRKAQRARDVLREIPISELVEMMKKAGELYLDATLPIGDGEQTPDDFARHQSATTGLPEHMCKANMAKNHFVLANMNRILDALTRGLDLEILTRGYGVESRGVTVSYQYQAPVVGS